MFCGNCGKEIKEGNKFCTNCGTQVIDEILNNSDLNETIRKAKSVLDYPDNTFLNLMDTIKFGHYFLDKGSKKSIEWLVLCKENNRALLLSKYALDYIKFNDANVNTTWETSSLRKWLNTEFLDVAFLNNEKDNILESNVSADHNDLGYDTYAGKDTIDMIFLLSSKELRQYFKAKTLRVCYATEYSNVISRRKEEDNEKPCSYWLRTSGDSSKQVMTVWDDGGYGGGAGVDQKNFIRPAMWIKIK